MKTKGLHPSIIPFTVVKATKAKTLGSISFPKSLESVGVKASAKTICFVRALDGKEVNHCFIGIDEKGSIAIEKIRQSGALFYQKLSAEQVKHAAIDADEFFKILGKDAAAGLRAFLEGFGMAAYRFDKYKSKVSEKKNFEELDIIATQSKTSQSAEKIAHEATIVLDSLFITRDFSNEPSNYGTPEYYAKEISRLCKLHGLRCTVLDEKAAKKENMDLFLSVGEGSERESRVVILEYTPKKAGKKVKTLSFVGKGVTFDSGGISLKPGAHMEDMKHDMTGAATLAGATFAAARLKANCKIVTVLVFCENMPSGNATQPGNIIKARNGKTVEILNTDAEGRLILADALDLAQDYKPDLMIDAATLTGACTIALGKFASALFVSDDKLVSHFEAATKKTDERLWQLPLWDDYFEDMKSATADMMNITYDGGGGTIRGAVFLKQFIRPNTNWAHLDIANRAYDIGYLPYNPRKGASGAYVRLLTELALDFS